MRSGDDVKPVLDKIKDTYARMSAAGSNVSQMQQCTKIISVLNNLWDNLIPTLNTQQNQWTPEWLRQQILQEDFRRRHTGGGAANKTAEGHVGLGGYGRTDPLLNKPFYPNGLVVGIHTWAPPGMKPPSGERARGGAVQGSGAQGDGAQGKADLGMFLMVEDVKGSEGDVGLVGKVVMHPLTHWVIDSGCTSHMNPWADLLDERKADISGVLIPWIRATRLQLHKRFHRDFPVMRLHSDTGGEFSSGLLAEFYRDEGIRQSFTLPASPQKNGIAERRIGLIMEVARTSMIHAAAPHFLWPFAVRYAAHQLNLWPHVSEPKTSPALWWTGKVGDALVFRVWGTLSLVRNAKLSKLSSCTLRCVFLGFPTDVPPWQFYHPRERRVFSSHDVTFDKSVCFYMLHPHASHRTHPPWLSLWRSLLTPLAQLRGVDPAADDTAATRRSPRLETPLGFPPRPYSPSPQPAAVDYGAENAGAERGGAETEGEGSGGAAIGGAGSGGASTGGVDSGGAASPSGGGAVGDPAGGPGAGHPPQPDLLETLLPQVIRAWIVLRGSPGSGGYGPAGARATSPGGTGAGGTRGVAGAGGARATSPRSATGAGGAGPTSPGGTASAGGARGTAGAGGAGGAGGAASAGGAAGARTGGAGAAKASGAVSVGGAGGTGAAGTRGTGASGAGGAASAGDGTGAAGTRGAGAAGTGAVGAAGTGGALTRGAGAVEEGGAAGAGGAGGATGAAGSGGAGGTAGAGGAGAEGTGGTGGAGAAGPGGARTRGAGAAGVGGAGGAGGATGVVGTGGAGGTADARGAGVAGARGAAGAGGAKGDTGAAGAGGAGDADAGGAGAAGSAPHRLFYTRSRNHPCCRLTRSFARSCLDYVTSLVTESESICPPSVGGELALGNDVLEDRQFELECLAVALPRFASMLLCPEGPDALDIPTPRSYAEAIAGGHFFHTFSPAPKMTTLRVLLHVAAQRDYELNSLDFSTTFLQGSLHEEIWLRRPPGFTGSVPAGTQWSLRRPVYGLRQVPRERHDTLRTTLAALGFAPSSADPSLFLHTDTTLPPFFVLVYVDDLVFATADTEALALVKAELQERHTCTNLDQLLNYLGLQITRDRARHTITLTQSHMVHQVLQCFGFQFSSRQPTPLSTGHSLSTPPSDESVEPSGPYPELGGCLICEAEIYAWAMAALELRWLTYLLTNLGERPRSPLVLYVDNKAMLALFGADDDVQDAEEDWRAEGNAGAEGGTEAGTAEDVFPEGAPGGDDDDGVEYWSRDGLPEKLRIPTYPPRNRKRPHPSSQNRDSRPPSPRHKPNDHKRQAYTAAEKLKWVAQLDVAVSVRTLARESGIHRKCLANWKRAADFLKEAHSARCRMHGRGRASWYRPMEIKVYERLLDWRRKGTAVSVGRLQEWSREFMKILYPLVKWKGSQWWSDRFRRRWNLSCKKFWQFVRDKRRERGIKTTWIINADQTPLWLEMPATTTVDQTGVRSVPSRSAGYQKERVTVMLACTVDGMKLKPWVFFKRKTVRKGVFAPDVVVACHENGWMDAEGVIRWFEESLKPFLKPGFERHARSSMVVLDSYCSHLTEGVKEKFRELNCVPAIIPSGCTAEV
ncbi:unnamed protein product [Closterium sp. NIES-54]